MPKQQENNKNYLFDLKKYFFRFKYSTDKNLKNNLFNFITFTVRNFCIKLPLHYIFNALYLENKLLLAKVYWKTHLFFTVLSIEILQIESTSHRPLCKWQRQSGISVRAKERDDGRFILSLSTRIALERDSLTLRITLARADRFHAGLSTLSVISLWFYHPQQYCHVFLIEHGIYCIYVVV